MALTISTGIFTGIDTKSVVSQLMAIERQPIAVLTKKRTDWQAKISAYGTLKSNLSKLRTAVQDLRSSSLESMSANTTSSAYSATATKEAAAGTYDIKVNNLATAQVINSTTFASDTAEVADLSGVTTQKLKIQVGSGTAAEISIDSSNNTLKGVRDAINAADVGVSASLVNAGFTVDDNNKTIVFNDGSVRTATLTAGTYTGEALAAEVKRALEAANGGTDTYSVGYDSTSNKFTVTNDAANANSIQMLWEDAGTTAESLLGFTAAAHAAQAAGESSTGDEAVGGYRLVLSAGSTGATNRIKISVDEDNDGTYGATAAEKDTTGLSRLAFDPSYTSVGAVDGGVANMSQTTAAVSASLVMNGVSVSRASNTIGDLIDGVTLTLKTDSAGKTESLTVARDTDAIVNKVNAFVSAYNTTSGLAQSLGGVTEKGGSLLSSDSMVLGIRDGLRQAITARYGNLSPALLGLSHSKTGVLSLDSAMFKARLSSDYDDTMTALDGFAKALDSQLSTYIADTIPSKTDNLNNSIKTADRRMLDIEARLRVTESALIKRFNTLEKVVGQMQSSSNFLAQHLAASSSSG